MRKFRTYGEVDHATGSRLLEQVVEQRERLAARLAGVGAVVAVASGKGGVGKSAVTANLAATLAARGHHVGALDADLNGPSLGRMFGVTGERLIEGDDGIEPVRGAGGVRVLSMELLQEEGDAPLRWRAAGSEGGDEPAEGSLRQSSMETTALREFLADVAWDGLDYLLVDVPPGTDKIGRLLELVPTLPMALLVTTPSEMSRSVVARSARLVREAGVPAAALVSNMAGYLCEECGTVRPLFRGNGAQRLAEETGLPIWAEIPFDPRLGESTDRGRPRVLDEPDGEAARRFSALADHVEAALADRVAPRPADRADPALPHRVDETPPDRPDPHGAAP